MVRIFRWLANKCEIINHKVSTWWNAWLKKIKM